MRFLISIISTIVSAAGTAQTTDTTNITLTNGDTVKISGKVSIVSNPVDTSKAGENFTVQLSGENNTTISYQVYVKPATSIQLYLPDN
ncbi:hypothetical protein B1745_00520 [Lactobacillus amylolyticus]|uniref:hypothetical protein n=1 Tax=Lactobacillus amylolyticus TaxID=83683 RepID=UPI0009B937CB|nr:hypothetical protein [Lactobacillus amylolyticus]ARD06218.1 hypothetical protein B1745_00520 [Lactobacillus amylolyticus]